MKYKIALSFLSIAFILFSCGDLPIDNQIDSRNLGQDIPKQASYNSSNVECEQLLSSADIYRRNGSYQDCVNTYNMSISEGCGDRYATQIYQWMGRAYIQLDKIDSAKWSVDKGLRILPEDLQLLNVAAFVSDKQDRSDDQLYYLDTKLQLEEEVQGMLSFIDSNSDTEEILDLQTALGMPIDYSDGLWSEIMNEYILAFKKGREDTYSLLSDYYQKEELYDEQIDILDDWQKYDPNNLSIFKKKKTAYINLGENPIDIDKERWEKDPSNIKAGLDYMGKLKEELLSEEIVDLALVLLDYDSGNKIVLENLAEAYLDLYEQDKALQAYNQLLVADNKNDKYLIQISKIYLDLGEYLKALEYSDRAVKIGSAEAYNNRAQIYKGIVDSCIGDELTMSDKAVYEMAWEDLKVAFNKGYKRAKKDANFLEKNFITQNRDWFLNVNEGIKIFSPTDDCYKMIDRKINKRSF